MHKERPPMRAALKPEHAQLLATVELFAHLDRVALSRFASYVEPFTVAAGADVIRQGDEGQELYIVARGSFGVFACSPEQLQETRLGTLQPGDCFGEMALLTGEPRSATVRAEADGELLELDRARFLELMRREPEIVLAIAASLSRRLRATDQTIVQRQRAIERALEGALAGASLREGRGDVDAAASTLREALQQLPLAADPAGAGPPTEQAGQHARPVGATIGGPGHGSPAAVGARRGPGFRAPLAVAVAIVLIGAGARLAGASPDRAFVALLGAALVLWVSELFPEGAVALGLMTAWLLFGIAQAAQAANGFGSTNWLFAIAVLGLAAAVARSGLLFRAGLLLVSRVPQGLLWQSGALLLTGLVLSPVLPSNMARAALTTPLALAIAEARGLRDREPAAAALGLAAWMGSGPLMFVFLDASTTTILGWSLLPESSRVRFDWVHWLLAALPLGVFASVGALAVLFLVLRPAATRATPRERLHLQLGVLGPPSRSEVAMIAVLTFTLVGWIVAPAAHVDMGSVAVLGLLGAVVTGNFRQAAFRELDWNYILFYGVALSIPALMIGLGLDRAGADAVSGSLAVISGNPAVFVLAVACLSLLARLLVPQDPAMLLLSLALIPVAPSLGVEPGLVVLTLAATSAVWFLPTQTPSYIVAWSASEGRLYSQAQARRVALAYTAVTLVGLALSVPYWHLVGLL